MSKNTEMSWSEVLDRPIQGVVSWPDIQDKPEYYPTDWSLIANKPTAEELKGEPGEQGPQGIQGIQGIQGPPGTTSFLGLTDLPTYFPTSWGSVASKPSWIGASKPTYTPSEVGAAPETHNHDTSYLGITAQAADSAKLGGSTLASVILAAYPVGAIYMSYSSTSPATLFGGTWSALPAGRFLRAGTGGSTGGSDTHAHSTTAVALTEDQIPSHVHAIKLYDSSGTQSTGYGVAGLYNKLDSGSTTNTQRKGSGAVHGHGNTGSASNVPAYYEVYAWRRTA